MAKGSNKEHRNISDYTPLSQAASGGYVNVIKVLLAHGAEINSRSAAVSYSILLAAGEIGATTCPENPEMLGNYTDVREMSGISVKIRELLEKFCRGGKLPKNFPQNCKVSHF